MKKSIVFGAVALAVSTGAMAAPSDQAFNQLTTRVSAAENEIKSVSGVAQSAQSGVAQLRADLQTVHQGVADAVQHAGSNSAAIAANKQAIQKAQDGVNSNAQAVNGLSSDFNALRTKVDTKADQSAVDSLRNDLTDVDNRKVEKNDFDQLSQTVTGVKAVADKAATDNARQDGQIRNIQTIVQNENNARKADIAANTAKVDTLGTKVDANKAATDKQIGDLQTHVDNGLVNLNTKVNTAQAAADKNAQAITGLGQRVTKVESDTAGLRTDVDANKQAISSLGTKVDAAQTGVDANKQAITATQVKVTANEQSIAKVQQQAALNASDLGKETAARTAADTKLQAGVDANKQGVTEAKTAAATADAKAVMAQDSATKVGQRLDTTDQTVSAMRGDVDTNTANINALHQWQQQANANLTGAVNDNSAGIARNSQRLDKVEKDVSKLKQDVADVKDQTKRVGALGMAAANLHYAGLDSGYAVALGQYSDKTAIAGGLQFNINEKTAATVQVAYDTKDFGGSVGIHGKW